MNLVNSYVFIPPAPVVLPFVSTWDTSKTSTGSSAGTQIKLPLHLLGTYNFVVQWGDGTENQITAYNQTEITHTYSVSGIYTVTISGICTGWYFNATGDRLKVSSVSKWGILKLGNSGHYFYGCSNLNLSSVSDVIDLTGTTTLINCFRECTALTTVNNINTWNTSSVINMFSMFGCPYATKGNFNQAISFDTSSVTTMSYMFTNTKLNSTVNINTQNVLTMDYMFWQCNSLNSLITLNNTGKVTTTYQMFQECTVFNQNLGVLDFTKNTNFSQMFYSATAFNNGGNSSINSWVINSTTNVNMNSMFAFAVNFNQPIGGWNMSKVTSLVQTFRGATNFNQNLNSWIFSVLTDISYMFWSATAFNQDLGNWNVSNVTTFENFMLGKTAATFSTTNLDALYNGWSSRPILAGKNISFGTAKYTSAGSAGRAILTSAPNNLVITDGGI